MALQKNSAGLWVDADGNYPVSLSHARKDKDGLYRFKFAAHPIGATETVESDTEYAYLPPGTFEVFVTHKWGRPFTDEEAEGANAGENDDLPASIPDDEEATQFIENSESVKAPVSDPVNVEAESRPTITLPKKGK